MDNGITATFDAYTYSSCKGASASSAVEREMEEKHLDVSHRRTSPTETPLFFRMARRVAPQRWGRMAGGALPEAKRFTNIVRGGAFHGLLDHNMTSVQALRE